MKNALNLLLGDEDLAIDGEICVNVFISGAAPFGTRFSDYGDCDSVRTNRPTGDYPIPNNSTEDDPRLEDPQYVEDLEWTKMQHEATAPALAVTPLPSPMRLACTTSTPESSGRIR